MDQVDKLVVSRDTIVAAPLKLRALDDFEVQHSWCLPRHHRRGPIEADMSRMHAINPNEVSRDTIVAAPLKL